MNSKSVNPSTGEVLKKIEGLGEKEVLGKIKAARIAGKSWREVSVERRGGLIKKLASVLRKKKEVYARLMAVEMGKPVKEGRAEVEKCAWLCEYYAENASRFLKPERIKTEMKKSYVMFEPLGVVLGVMPWNFPFWQVFRCVIPALVAGNVCVVKHASNVPQCALAIEGVFNAVGFKKGVYTTVITDVKTILKSIPWVDGVSVTGSVAAGRSIAEVAGRAGKKTVLELGGSDPFIVLEDADLEKACEGAVKSRFLNGGQSCIAGKRFVVVEKVREEFERRVVEKIKQLKVSDPLREETDLGPLAKEEFVKIIKKQVRDALAAGGMLLYGGKEMKGAYMMPTILTNVSSESSVYREEVFGPVFSIIPVKGEKEAVEVANNSSFGLGASVWTKDLRKGERVATQLEAGMVFVNGIVKSDPRLPFGGVKDSGYGRELSWYGLREFVNVKTVVIN